jgi:TPP-dependent pyruvate/acetoin dehydrogenase alpha subunit
MWLTMCVASNDPITGLKTRLLEWGVTEEAELKVIVHDSRSILHGFLHLTDRPDVPV